jgi:L-ascorbate peroxidase
VRAAWHDSGTYNHYVGLENWPRCGGANGLEYRIHAVSKLISPALIIGSVRFELSHGSNAGLQGAITLLQPLKDQYPAISWADLLQLASVTAIEFSGLHFLPPLLFLFPHHSSYQAVLKSLSVTEELM